ncbi:hypothetical protein HYALB_00000679 [Hymenoscyphus albidus]|uniref:Chromo domain-containing protein n=1 Tax=Hymenoscyphus albidus TaxID=595503 RepID=A0A9N9LT86_9HELO|nr:hypothetical protein HYALB_00000679 [Hymenoscyphus albidus]
MCSYWDGSQSRRSRGGTSVLVSAWLCTRLYGSHKASNWVRAADWRSFCNKDLWQDHILRDPQRQHRASSLLRHSYTLLCSLKLSIENSKSSSYINPGIPPLATTLPSIIVHLALTMDDIIFYQPPSASKNRPPRLLGVRTTLNGFGASGASVPIRQTAPDFNQQNNPSKDNITESRDLSDSSQKRHPVQRYRNNKVQMQENSTVAPNPLGSNDDDDFPEIDELLSGMKQQNHLASADPNSDNNNNDDDFPDIDELLSGIRQKSVLASAKPNHSKIAEKINNRDRRDGPLNSSCSEGSTQDPIILSDDESTGAESETDYTDPDVDLTANSCPHSPHIADNELMDGFSSRAALTPHCLVADHQDDNDKNSGEIDNTQLQLPADRPRSASPSQWSITYQASKQIDTDNIQGSTNLDVTKELENRGSDISIEGSAEDGDGTCSTKERELSAVSVKNPVSDSNILEQSLQLDLAAASPQESDLKNDHLPKRRLRGVTENFRRKSPRTIAPIRLASTASAALRPSAESQSRAQITTLDREIVNDGSTNDSNDGDYDDRNVATGSRRGFRLRKPVRRTKDTGDCNAAAYPTHSLDVPCQAAEAISSGSMQESEEIPIHGSFTLKIVESKVLYCLTFSQESSPLFQSQGQRQDSPTDLEEPQPAASITDPTQEWGIHKITGQKMVRGERHFRVEWNETWMPESELAGAEELVEAFMTEVGTGTRGRKPPQKRGRLATGLADDLNKGEPKKRRRQPRKQM